jgi:hypothetical protein
VPCILVARTARSDDFHVLPCLWCRVPRRSEPQDPSSFWDGRTQNVAMHYDKQSAVVFHRKTKVSTQFTNPELERLLKAVRLFFFFLSPSNIRIVRTRDVGIDRIAITQREPMVLQTVSSSCNTSHTVCPPPIHPWSSRFFPAVLAIGSSCERFFFAWAPHRMPTCVGPSRCNIPCRICLNPTIPPHVTSSNPKYRGGAVSGIPVGWWN